MNEQGRIYTVHVCDIKTRSTRTIYRGSCPCGSDFELKPWHVSYAYSNPSRGVRYICCGHREYVENVPKKMPPVTTGWRLKRYIYGHNKTDTGIRLTKTKEMYRMFDKDGAQAEEKKELNYTISIDVQKPVVEFINNQGKVQSIDKVPQNFSVRYTQKPVQGGSDLNAVPDLAIQRYNELYPQHRLLCDSEERDLMSHNIRTYGHAGRYHNYSGSFVERLVVLEDVLRLARACPNLTLLPQAGLHSFFIDIATNAGDLYRIGKGKTSFERCVDEVAKRYNLDITASRPHEIFNVSKRSLEILRRAHSYTGLHHVSQARDIASRCGISLYDLQEAVRRIPDGIERYELPPRMLDGAELFRGDSLGQIEFLVDGHAYDIHQLAAYADRCMLYQGITRREEVFNLLTDYIRMCDALGIEDYERYPRALKKAHDVVLMQYRTVDKERLDGDLKKVAEELEELEFIHGDYQIKIPRTSHDIRAEGQRLSHCVGGIHAQRMAKREQIVFFVRKIDEPDVPLVTMAASTDMDQRVVPKIRVIQARGRSNSYPSKEIVDFLNKWSKSSNKYNIEIRQM